MGLREQLDSDMKAALKSRESLRLETIRGARGAIRNKEIEVGDALDDDGIMRVLRTLVKQRMDSVEQFRAAGRDDLADKELSEQAVLERYLPRAPDAAEIEKVVVQLIAEVGAEGPRDLGKVMQPALERLGPAADGKRVSETVKRLLSGS
ncbi:MAG: GatB/YqeY domain-containing protein [Deltaproteobacteria bacterium]|nr:GatB/YqeY domain-containing protein [Myxococcales bacterium]TDJ13037.1 MAG: GatB/YqeY domain-containing protein [Deltaproteobacteria bacterium]TDJ16702.1 MAG: GatB/YqeY domain-containing protein [Deltaproteobacteria bacterium]